MPSETPPSPPSPDHLMGDRIAAVRRVLKEAQPLTPDQYVAGQTLLVMLDLLTEMRAQQDGLAEALEYMREITVHGVRVRK